MKNISLRIIICFALLALFLTPLLPSHIVQASSTLTLRPNANGDIIALSKSGGTFNWEMVDESVADDDATYVYDINASLTDLYNFPAHTSEAGLINSVTVYVKAKNVVGSGQLKIYLQTSSGHYDDSGLINLTSNYALYSHEWTTNFETGLPFTWSDIDLIQAGPNLLGSVYEHRCTQVYVEVDFTVSAPPTVITGAASIIKRTTAALNGTVNSTDGGNPSVIVVWGITDGGNVYGAWSNNSTPTSPSQPQGIGVFVKNVTALSSNTLYYFNTSATNYGGTGWGTSQNFTTLSLTSSESGWTMIDIPHIAPTGLFTEGGHDFPMGQIIYDAAVTMGQDPTTWLFIFAFGMAGLIAIGVYAFTHIAKMGQKGSLFLAVIVAECILIYFYTTETIPGLALIPLGIIGVMLIVWRKSPAPME